MSTDKDKPTKSGPAGRSPGEPLRVLIVEDEIVPAMLLETVVTDVGHAALRAARLPKALDLARNEPVDAAVLDVNIAGESVFPVAALLREQGVPFLFATGYGRSGLPAEYDDCVVLQKPYSRSGFGVAFESLLQDAGLHGQQP